MDCSLPDSSVHGIFQARVLEWIATSFCRGSSLPRDRTRVSHIVDRCLTVWATREVQHTVNAVVILLLSHSQLFCDPMDCRPPGSSIHGISQARKLKWVAISFSRGSSRPRPMAWTCISYVSCIGRQIVYPWATWKSPVNAVRFIKLKEKCGCCFSLGCFNRVP